MKRNWKLLLCLNLLAVAEITLGLTAELPERAPDFVWARRAGGVAADKTRDLATDSSGHIYLTGEFSGKADFGGVALESRGQLDFFVAKYSPQGECLWARSAGGNAIDRGYGVAVDGRGNVFVTGHCQSTNATFDGQPLPEHRGDYDLFVAKYDAQGTLLWVKSGGGTGYDFGHGIGVDNAGNCYVTGTLVVDATMATPAYPASNRSRAFLARYTPEGQLLWRRIPSGAGSSVSQHLSLTPQGDCVVAGSLTGSQSFGEVTLANRKGRDLFLVRYDAQGTARWGIQGDGSTNASATCVAFDGQGDVYVSGAFQGTLMVGGQTFTSRGGHDWFALKASAQGKVLWTRHGGGPGTDYALSVKGDGKGNCYLAGEITGETLFAGHPVKAVGGRDLYAAKFDSQGSLRWLRIGGSQQNDLGYAIALDDAGNIYLSGAFDGSTLYGQHPLISAGRNDIMLLKLGK